MDGPAVAFLRIDTIDANLKDPCVHEVQEAQEVVCAVEPALVVPSPEMKLLVQVSPAASVVSPPSMWDI
tara:strand:+ start:523 stop:729 length:207 start_codon:yes stop_codon:yes gene_type:complete